MKLSLRMNRKTVMTCAAAGLMCLVGLAMPEVTLAAKDRALTSRVESVETDEVALSLLTELTVGQKLALAGDSSATDIPLSTGKVMDRDAAVKEARMRAGIDARDVISSDASARLRVGADGSALILWRVEQTGDYWALTMLLDDGTGSVLGFELSAWDDRPVDPWDNKIEAGWPDPDEEIDLTEPVWMFLGALGLDVADFNFQDPFTAQVSVVGGPVIPVTVRYDGEVYISINM